MTRQDLLLLYEYNYWANKRILSAAARVSQEQFVAPTSHNYGTLRNTLVHTLDAEASWRTRCESGAFGEEILETAFPTVAQLVQRWTTEEQAMRAFLASLQDTELDRLVSYPIDTGTRSRVLWHCLFHVVNHGTQHRSEAADMLTGYGHSPGDLDFTVFLLERNATQPESKP